MCSYIMPDHTNLLSTPYFFFFFNDTATTEIYTLSLHDALPISSRPTATRSFASSSARGCVSCHAGLGSTGSSSLPPTRCLRNRSEEHTSELQSPDQLVCRLLLEKKNSIRPCPHRRRSSRPVFCI